VDAESFDLNAYLAGLDPLKLATRDGRLELTCTDPLAFAAVYLLHHIKQDDGTVTLADLHLGLVEDAKRWMTPGASRDCYVAPRSCGKSTWAFLILPIWGAAFGYVKFVAAFANASAQAEQHLASFKHELESNDLLRADFPDLCTPARRLNGRTESDNEYAYMSRSRFMFVAKGVDRGSLGMKVGSRRPDLLILDDIEPDESNYSALLKEKRLTTILDAVLPLNDRARVVISGTVTMPDSIIHECVKYAAGVPVQWIEDARITVHHFLPVVTRPDGTERSIWPGRWTLDDLKKMSKTRGYAKNFLNSPLGNDGEYWNADDFKYGTVTPLPSTILSVDPALTTGKRSDYTGMAIVGLSVEERRYVVRDCFEVKLGPAALRARILELIDANPDIAGVLIETNQGGSVWKAVLGGLPVPIYEVHQRESKETRATRVLAAYQHGYVLHEKPLNDLEQQMVAFPRGVHDDMVDAVTSGVNWLMNGAKKKRQASKSRPSVHVASYL